MRMTMPCSSPLPRFSEDQTTSEKRRDCLWASMAFALRMPPSQKTPILIELPLVP